MSLIILAFIDIADIWSRPGIKGGNTAVYMVIKNNDTLPDTLYKITSPVSRKAEIHTSFKDKGGRMGMEKVDYVVIPPKGEFVFEPGKYHIMLINLKKPLRGGKRFKLTLFFRRAGKIEVEVKVG